MTSKSELKPWFEIKELSDSYENSVRRAKFLAKASRFSEPINFEEAFAESLCEELNKKYGQFWILRPTIVSYSMIMSQEAVEEYQNDEEEQYE